MKYCCILSSGGVARDPRSHGILDWVCTRDERGRHSLSVLSPLGF
jgi:hypothetical protein